jgi:hypothetical protein
VAADLGCVEAKKGSAGGMECELGMVTGAAAYHGCSKHALIVLRVDPLQQSNLQADKVDWNSP